MASKCSGLYRYSGALDVMGWGSCNFFVMPVLSVVQPCVVWMKHETLWDTALSQLLHSTLEGSLSAAVA